MGLTYVDVVIRNPADMTREWQGKFLVGTGAIESLVPRPILEAIGLEPLTQRTYELADGTEVRMDVAGAAMELLGEFTAGLVIFGDANAEPVLGSTAMDSAGIEFDPKNQRLNKLPFVRLKKTWPKAMLPVHAAGHAGGVTASSRCA